MTNEKKASFSSNSGALAALASRQQVIFLCRLRNPVMLNLDKSR
ncbi:hypothetical protein [Roseibium suaedae]|nr:hypothetical protein [Roseibium suaedae]